MKRTVEIIAKDTTVEAMRDELRRQIALRAEQIAAERSYTSSPLENWVAAENQLFWKPEAQVRETEREITAKFRLPEVQGEDVQIYADSQSIVVTGTQANGPGNGAKVLYSDFRSGQIYREMELPGPVDLQKAKARLTDGVLVLSLPKPQPQVEVVPTKVPAKAKKAKAKKE
jgi:HSP20 family molecular chaperone IbpA